MNQEKGNQTIDSQNLVDTSCVPVDKWTEQDVADWARKVVAYSKLPEDEQFAFDNSLKIVIDQAINGTALLLFEDVVHLQSSMNLLIGHALILWDNIEKMKPLTEPPRELLGSSKCRRDEVSQESDEEPAPKRSRVDTWDQSYPPTKLNLSQCKQQKAVQVALQTLLIGRTKELTKLKSLVEQNLAILFMRPATLVISGPGGIGKSHLALKLIEQVKFDWSLTITATPDSNPNQLLWEEFGLPGTSTMNNYEMFMLIVNSLPGKDIMTDPFKIAIYFDEIHRFEKQDLLRLQHDITAINSKFGTQGLIQLILTGVSATFISLDLGADSSSGAFNVTNLQPFTHSDSIALLNAALAETSVTTDLTSHEIEHAISWFGGNPRLIEFAASHLKQNPKHNVYTLINSVTESFSSLYASRLVEKKSMYPIITAACLSQLPVRYNDDLKSENATVKVSYLVKNGIVGFKPLSSEELYGEHTLGFLTISLLEVRKFVQMNNLYFNVPLLMDPKEWTWSQFEVK